MKIDIKVPSVGESVHEAVLAQWYRKDGDLVHKDDVLFLLETDKVTLEVSAEAGGVLKILVPEGETVAVGTVVGTLDSEAESAGPKPTEKEAAAPAARAPERVATQAPPPEPPLAQPAPPEPGLSPSVRRLAEEKGVDASQIAGTGPGGRVTKGDVLLHLEESSPSVAAAAGPMAAGAAVPHVEGQAAPQAGPPGTTAPVQPRSTAAPSRRPAEAELKAVHAGGQTTRKAMSPIRMRIAERLLEARQNTAMLTTFNEIDMSRLQSIRARFKDRFKERYGIPLGIMSFFVKASIEALKEIPEINAFLEGNEIVYHHYYHIGVAVGTERGLVVPVIRHADQLSFAEVEGAIVDFVGKIRENRLEIADLEGGTFTVSNGGIYGSLLSTPILNTPQSGILGMHKIEERPVVVNGQVVVRPMMYVALSYDHRIVDGREAVTFLKRVKECVEEPERIMMEI